MSVGGSQEGKRVLDNHLGQLSASLSGTDTAHQQSCAVCVCLCWTKEVQSLCPHGTESICLPLFVLARKGYRDTETVLGGKEERFTFLLDRGTLRKFWTGDNPPHSPFTGSVPLLCRWRIEGLSCGCKCLFFCSCRLLLDVSRRLEDPWQRVL